MNSTRAGQPRMKTHVKQKFYHTRDETYLGSHVDRPLEWVGCQWWETLSAFFWDCSGYSYSGLGITEYTEFQFPKERSFILKTEYSWER